MTPPLGLLSSSLGSTSTASSAGTTVAQTDRPALARIATDLSIDASVVVAFGGSSNSALTYNAAGLLNSLAQAGTDMALPPSAGDALHGPTTEQAIIGALTGDPQTSGFYTASGALLGLPGADLSAHWATILKSNPDLAGTVVASSLAQGITRSLLARA